MCIHGKPFCVLACIGRETEDTDYMPFTLDWNPLPEYNKMENYMIYQNRKSWTK